MENGDAIGKKQLKKGVVFSYFNLGATIIVSLTYTPFLVRMLGQSEFGLYSLAFSIIGSFWILDLGLGNANIRYTAKYRNCGDRDKERNLHSMFLFIYLAMSVVAIIIGTILYLNAARVFGEKMSGSEISRIKTMLLFVVPSIALSLPLSVFSNIIKGYERFVFQQLIEFVNIISIPILSIVVLMSGFRSIALIAFISVSLVLLRLVEAFYCFKKLKIRFGFNQFDTGLFREIFRYSAFILLGVAALHINFNSGNLILSIVSGTVAVAIYALGFSLYLYFVRLASAINNLLLPVISVIPEDGMEQAKYNGYFISVGRIQFYLLALFFLGFLIYGRQFLAFWVGPGYELSFYVCLFLISTSGINLIQSVGVTILQAQNRHQFYSMLIFFMSLVNVGISIWLSKEYGPVGTAISLSVIWLIGHGILMNIYYLKKTQLEVGKFWVGIIKITPSFIFPVLFGVAYVHFYHASDWFSLTIGILGFLVLYIVNVFFISLDKFEKELVLKPILKTLGFIKLHLDTRWKKG